MQIAQTQYSSEALVFVAFCATARIPPGVPNATRHPATAPPRVAAARARRKRQRPAASICAGAHAPGVPSSWRPRTCIRAGAVPRRQRLLHQRLRLPGLGRLRPCTALSSHRIIPGRLRLLHRRLTLPALAACAHAHAITTASQKGPLRKGCLCSPCSASACPCFALAAVNDRAARHYASASSVHARVCPTCGAR